MSELFTNHGTGDTYMTLAFAHHAAMPVVYGNPQHAVIAAMFPHIESRHGQFGEVAIQVHPESNPPMGLSRYALIDRHVTHADLWRGILSLPLDAEMKRGRFDTNLKPIPNKVFMIDKARSWPNHHPEFWNKLEAALKASGWDVTRNLEAESLNTVFEYCSIAEWVIGPQCGVMAIICHAMFPCRKTIATPAVEGTNWIVPRTFPYAYVSKFAGEDYGDVEEVKFTADCRLAIEQIMSGPHANHSPVKRRQVSGVEVALTHGDFFDRLSILDVKVFRFAPERRAMIMREYLRYKEIAEPLFARYGQPLINAYGHLVASNSAAFDHNEKSVTDMYLTGIELSSHFALAARHNRDRVRLKNEINAICGSAHDEIKSYYEGGKA